MRDALKSFARGVSLVLVLPSLMSYALKSLVLGPDRALEGSTQLLALVPGIMGQYLRRAFLARVLAGCHDTATIEFGTLFSAAGARLDEHVYVGPRCHLGLVHLEREVLVAAGVHIPSGAHIHGSGDTSLPLREQGLSRTLVTIGEGSWIGSAAVVMADVGRRTIVGAGSVVTRPLPDDVIAAGAPARVVHPAWRSHAAGRGQEMNPVSGPDGIRVLYLVHRVPYAPNRGDRIRAYHTLRVLREAGIRTHVVAFAHDDAEAAEASRLGEIAESYDVLRIPGWRNRARALAALNGGTPLTHVLLDHPQAESVISARLASFAPDLVVAFCSGMARFAMQAPLASLPLILDMVDLDSTKWRELSTSESLPMRLIYAREARALGLFEREACAHAEAVLVVNEREAVELRTVAPNAPVVVVPNGVDLDYFRRPSETPRKPQAVFTAVFDYAPNEAGAVWAIDEVWPRVLAVRQEAELVLAGARPTPALQRLAARAPRVVVTGSVEDIRPHLWSASVAIAPLTVARGTQNKVIEAAAAELRSVVTPSVSRGLPPAVLPWCTVAESPERFAAAIVEELATAVHPQVGASLDGLRWQSSLAPIVRRITELTRPARAAGDAVYLDAGAAPGR